MDDNLARCAVFTIVAVLVLEWPDILETMLLAVLIGFVLTLAWVAIDWFWYGYRSEQAA